MNQIHSIDTGLFRHKQALETCAPDTKFIFDARELKPYECDAFSAYTCLPGAVALPSTTADVAAILRYCYEHNIRVVPRGAGTSLVGGSLPVEDSLVIGLSRMNRVVNYHPDNRQITVETGITNLEVSRIVKDDGLFYAPDPSSQIACSIGGNIAMNSGGAHCLKYGVTANNLIAVKLVTIEGEILDLHTDDGIDLRALICGAEGQLGVVTEAVLKLEPLPLGARPVMIAFSTNEDAAACVSAIIAAGVVPVAIEFMDKMMIEATDRYIGAGYPECEAMLIIEAEGDAEKIAEDIDRISKIAEAFQPVKIEAARDEAHGAKIWAGRKAAFGAMGHLADYICLDGVIPVSKLAEALSETNRMAAEFGLRVSNVFHAGDGNMHPLILYDAQVEGDLAKAEALGAEILALCVRLGGCLTGEHGVGIEKRDLMPLQYDEASLEMQMRIKDVFDVKWLLNDEKVFPLELSAQRRHARGGEATS